MGHPHQADLASETPPGTLRAGHGSPFIESMDEEIGGEQGLRARQMLAPAASTLSLSWLGSLLLSEASFPHLEHATA